MRSGCPISDISDGRHPVKNPSLELPWVHAVNFFGVRVVERRPYCRCIGQIFLEPRLVAPQIDRRNQHSTAEFSFPL
jgi:hypothetical protein